MLQSKRGNVVPQNNMDGISSLIVKKKVSLKRFHVNRIFVIRKQERAGIGICKRLTSKGLFAHFLA